jgi:hypothetical protein
MAGAGWGTVIALEVMPHEKAKTVTTGRSP